MSRCSSLTCPPRRRCGGWPARCSRPAADPRIGEQCRRVLEHPPRHRRRAGTHLCGQPSGAVPADQPAPGPARAERPGPWSLSPPTLTPRDALTSTTCRAHCPTRAAGHTANPSSPTSCSPISWRNDARVRSHRQRAASRRGADIIWSRGPRAHPATPGPVTAAGHEVAGPGRRDVNPPGVGLELAQVSGRYFANRRPTKSSTRSYDQAVAARLWEASADLVSLTAAPRA